MTIKKKTWPDSFAKVLSGDKTFELRLNDWEANEGDTLVLEEWDPETKEYTGRSIEKKIGYVLKMNEIPKFHAQEEIDKYGFMIISLKDNA